MKSSALIPGVVMRVTDSNNNIVYDSLPMYISINHVQDSLARQEEHPQIEDYIRNAFLPSDLKFVNFKHFWIFYTQRTIVKTMKRIHFISCERLQQKKYF